MTLTAIEREFACYSLEILLVGSDLVERDRLSRYLQSHGCHVVTTSTLKACQIIFNHHLPDLLISSSRLPDGSAIDLCGEIRRRYPQMPVILLAVDSDAVERIIALELGADDCLAKPVNPRELLARIIAVLRRTSSIMRGKAKATRYHFANMTLDIEACRLSKDAGGTITLTRSEFRLLAALLDCAGIALTRRQLIDQTKGHGHAVGDRAIDILMCRLRRKLGHNSVSPIFRSVRNSGYQMAVPVMTGASTEEALG